MSGPGGEAVSRGDVKLSETILHRCEPIADTFHAIAGRGSGLRGHLLRFFHESLELFENRLGRMRVRIGIFIHEEELGWWRDFAAHDQSDKKEHRENVGSDSCHVAHHAGRFAETNSGGDRRHEQEDESLGEHSRN